MHANRVDVRVSAVRGVCFSYLGIDASHIRINPVTEIRWRAEKMSAAFTMRYFRDLVGQHIFLDDKNQSLLNAIEGEGTLHLKTIGTNGTASFAVSTKGYNCAAHTISWADHRNRLQ
jgi:hypothetical protein